MALIVLAAAGVMLMVWGIALFSFPAGLIAAGAACVAVAYLIAEESEP